MKWYLKVFKQYADFNGRAGRAEYWMFTLFNMIFIFVAMILDELAFEYEISFTLYSWAVFIPSFAVMVRRLHDVGKSGWNCLWCVTIIGTIPVLCWLVENSHPGNNKYGSNAKEVEPPETKNIEEDFQNQHIIDIPSVCPHCKNPNTKKIRLCEWCGNKIC